MVNDLPFCLLSQRRKERKKEGRPWLPSGKHIAFLFLEGKSAARGKKEEKGKKREGEKGKKGERNKVIFVDFFFTWSHRGDEEGGGKKGRRGGEKGGKGVMNVVIFELLITQRG